MKKVLFLRKKLKGQNSMEELAYTLVKHIPGLELCVLPCYSTSFIGMIKNSIYAYKHKGDVNHIFSITDAYLCLVLPGRKIVTCHDVGTLGSLSFYGRIAARIFWVYLPSLFWNVCTCISGQTAKELCRLVPWSRRKIEIIYNPLNPLFIPSLRPINDPPVVLHVGTAKRKNLLNVIEALKGIKCKLIIVGILFPEQEKALKQVDYQWQIYSDISVEEMVALYGSADIISFPSSYEGFGMPVVEGNAVGRIVIAGDIPVLHEVSGEAACFVNPSDIKLLHESFEKIISDSAYREKICELGLINAKRFEITNIANQYTRIYSDFQ